MVRQAVQVASGLRLRANALARKIAEPGPLNVDRIEEVAIHLSEPLAVKGQT